jgi:long-chain acyl-CoA synthetase
MREDSTQSIFPVSYLYKNEEECPNQIYLRQPIAGQWHEYTWKQTMGVARRLANFLIGQGLQPGDRVAILSKNCAEWIMADFAIMLAGMVSVPLYASQHADDIRYILEHSGCRLIFIGKLDHSEIQKPGIPENLKRVALPYPNSIRADFHWETLLDEYLPMKENPLPNPSDLMTIIYTSGTTGDPKGVMINYDTLAEYQRAAKVDFKDLHFPDFLHFISYLPLAHVVERVAIELLSVDWKSTVSFVESVHTFADNIKSISPDVFFAVPRIWKVFQTGILAKMSDKKLALLLKIPVLNHLIKKKIKSALGLHRSVINVSGAAPISPSLISWFDQIGIMIYEGYGQTENLAYATLSKPDHRKIGSVGKCRNGVEAKLSVEGELLLKSPGTMAGYYRDPELTASLYTEDGFMRTGDLAEIDKEGFVSIIGRVKEPFKTTKGEFVVPVPIEHQFAHNPMIEECCLVGSGLNLPILLISLSIVAKNKPPEVVEKSLMETLTRINAGLLHYEQVGHLYIVKSEWTVENHLLTPTQKIKRPAIEATYQSQFANIDLTKQIIIWEQD